MWSDHRGGAGRGAEARLGLWPVGSALLLSRGFRGTCGGCRGEPGPGLRAGCRCPAGLILLPHRLPLPGKVTGCPHCPPWLRLRETVLSHCVLQPSFFPASLCSGQGVALPFSDLLSCPRGKKINKQEGFSSSQSLITTWVSLDPYTFPERDTRCRAAQGSSLDGTQTLRQPFHRLLALQPRGTVAETPQLVEDALFLALGRWMCQALSCSLSFLSLCRACASRLPFRLPQPPVNFPFPE